MRIRNALGPAVLCLVALACSDPGGVGAVCEAPNDCADDLLGCFDRDDAEQALCMEACTASDFFCADGSLCLETDGDDFVCYLGGGRGVGDACTSNTQCAQGALCIEEEPGALTCRVACEPGGADDCPSGTACQPLEDGGGFCQSTT